MLMANRTKEAKEKIEFGNKNKTLINKQAFNLTQNSTQTGKKNKTMNLNNKIINDTNISMIKNMTLISKKEVNFTIKSTQSGIKNNTNIVKNKVNNGTRNMVVNKTLNQTTKRVDRLENINDTLRESSEKDNVAKITELINAKNTTVSHDFDKDLLDGNGTMGEYEYDEINNKTLIEEINYKGDYSSQETTEPPKRIINKNIENSEIYDEELQDEEKNEKIEEAKLVKARPLDEVFATSKEKLSKLCEIEQIEPQNFFEKDKEINLDEAVNKAKNEIHKCLTMKKDCIANKYKNNKENLEINGVKLGLHEVDHLKSNVASKFAFNENLIMQGNSALDNQLLEVSKNGAVYRKLFNINRNSFTKTSGFINREVRYARAIYCVKNLTLNMLEIYHSEPKTREASLNYTIAGIWIRNDPKIKNFMKSVEDSRNKLIKDRSLNNTYREDIFNGILNVAKMENSYGEKGSSSMAIFGYIVFDKFKNQHEFNKCSKDNKCIIFFYVKGKN
uniref:PRESAN domain-containing protein n=1 Tax=Meloidogyne hapla TaxID=6305 RepID=A0A1I8BD00_MELHA